MAEALPCAVSSVQALASTLLQVVVLHAQSAQHARAWAASPWLLKLMHACAAPCKDARALADVCFAQHAAKHTCMMYALLRAEHGNP